MKVNTPDIDNCDTSLVGYIVITHKELVDKLGKGLGPSDKVLDSWIISLNIDGEDIIATIYDWKNYGGNPEYITNWHIGGHDSRALRVIKTIFPNAGVSSAEIY